MTISVDDAVGSRFPEAQRRVRRLVESEFRARDLHTTVEASQDLRELGLSSLGIVNLVLLVESEFGIGLLDSDVNLHNFSTIDSIARLVARTVNS